MPLIRLQKFLSSAGFCSRRRGEVYIREGHVRVNGQVVTELGRLGGEPVSGQLHAVAGVAGETDDHTIDLDDLFGH